MKTNTASSSSAAEPPPAEGPGLVSVIMPAYNVGDVLARAVASVQAQGYGEWELLIVDDGSDDDTGALARALAETDPRIRALSLSENRGAAAARNHAIAAAHGRYIAFLDADDEWLPRKLERQIGWMRANDIAFGFTAFLRGHDRDWVRVDVPARVSHARLLRGNVIGCLTVILDRHALGEIEMPGFARRQDFALWLKLLRRVPHAHGLNEPLACYHRDPGRPTLSSGLVRGMRASFRVYREQEGLGRLAALSCLASHLMRRLARRTRLTEAEFEALLD